MYLPVAIPPGIYRDGSEGQSRGRWRSCNLVRSYGQDVGPILGWRQRASGTVTGVARSIYTWAENDAITRRIGIGTNSHLYVMAEAGTLYDVTPSGLVTGGADASINTGFGGGTFGTGAFGTPRLDNAEYTPAATWDLDNFGQEFVGCLNCDGGIYHWQNVVTDVATIISEAPTSCLGLRVTQNRFLLAFGANGNARNVAWCDQEDYTNWSPDSTNQAGDQDLNTEGYYIASADMAIGTLIITSTDAHICQYIGLPYVHGFQKVGENCGAFSAHCIVNRGDLAMWWGRSGFWIYDGSVREVECPIRDILDNLNVNQRSKLISFHNSRYFEFWWHYPSNASDEVDSYVAYNYLTGEWHEGSLIRTAASARGVFEYPLLIGTDGLVYEHEVGNVYGGVTPSIRSGPIEIGDGSAVMRVTGILPELSVDNNGVEVGFYTRLYPNGAETAIPAVSVAVGRTDLRFTGRQADMEILFTSSSARFGRARLEVSAGGRR